MLTLINSSSAKYEPKNSHPSIHLTSDIVLADNGCVTLPSYNILFKSTYTKQIGLFSFCLVFGVQHDLCRLVGQNVFFVLEWGTQTAEWALDDEWSELSLKVEGLPQSLSRVAGLFWAMQNKCLYTVNMLVGPKIALFKCHHVKWTV